MTTPHPFSDLLRDAIRESGLSAYAVAKRSGVAIQMITRWLAGERDITLTTADRIAAGLGIDPRKKSPKKSPVAS